MIFYAQAIHNHALVISDTLLQQAFLYLQELLEKGEMLSIHALEDDSGTVAVLKCETLAKAQQLVTNHPSHDSFEWEIGKLSGDVNHRFQLNPERDVMDILAQAMQVALTS